MKLFARYSNYLDTRPFAGRLLTGTVLCFFGDILTQTVIEKRSFSALFDENASKKSQFDVPRSIRAGFIGLTAISLNLYGWYSKLLPFIFQRFGHTHLFKTYPTAVTTFMGKLFSQFS